MAKAARPDEYTLYDIAPAFQNKLAEWLSKTNVVVDIGVGEGRAFRVAIDPWGTETGYDSFEEALDQAMKSRSKKKYIDPELETKVHEFLKSIDGHLTFGATDDVFKVVVSNADSRGTASDEDLEIAIVLAEEEFWDNMPAHPLAPADREALAHAVMGSPVALEEEREDAAPAQLHHALFVPRPELEANRSQRYADWVAEVDDELTAIGGRFDDAQPAYWRQLYQAGFSSSEAVQEFGSTRMDVLESNDGHPHRTTARWQRPSGHVPPPPPSRIEAGRRREMRAASEKPFDPYAQREHYSRPHHFAVNAQWSRAYINSLPDTAFLHVEAGGHRDQHGRSHPLSLRHLPYKDRSGRTDQAHLLAALSRAGQTRPPKHVQESVFEKAEQIYEREFGHKLAANPDTGRRARGPGWEHGQPYGDLINQSAYTHYVVSDRGIESGWEYREDAADAARQDGGKVLAKRTLKSGGLDPDDNANWVTA